MRLILIQFYSRAWLIPFWQLPVQWVFAALPVGILVTLLFYFDNNVSSLMAQSRQFPIKRPAGFHWVGLRLHY